jgi:ribose transport system ATP-binding protein
MFEHEESLPPKQVILELHDINKAFGGISALSVVSFDLQAGEIHALVGENGAGKSTLIKIITGAYTPDQGSITLNGTTYDGLTPDLARNLGIGVVYQEFNILPELSVAENVFLETPPMRRFGFIDIKTRAEKTYEILERLGAQKNINPNTLVKNLTIGEQQIVEITKALAADSRILILDEPSAVLPSQDMDLLFNVIRTLRVENRGIIYISHRLNEIFELADRVTVLKDGQTVITKAVSETNNDELIHYMVGRNLTDMYPPADTQPGDVLLDVSDLCVEGTVYGINLQVRAGEIVGLAGLGGSGRTTVCRALVGLGEIRGGKVQYCGKRAPTSPAAAAKAGLVLIPEDRKAYGLVLNQTMRFNLALPNLFQLERVGMIHTAKEAEAVNKAIADVQIRPSNPNIATENLSGGNQQKVVVGKWLLTQPKLVIFDEPTRGIDIGAKADIYQRMRELTHRGVGVIMASSELPELIGMCDRILVFHEGSITGELARADYSEEAIMRLATASEAPAGKKC